MTKPTLIWICLSALGAAVCAHADDLPTKFNFDRYKAMIEHSPFAVASALIAPAVAPNFAKDLYVANAARSTEEDMVTIGSSSDKDFKKYLTTKAPVDGYSIASIEWSDKVGKTKVTISKDGQLATLNFNEMLSAQPLPMPNRPVPGTMPAAPQSSFQRPVGVPTPTPNVRGVIQRNPQGQTPNPSSQD
jgi:hypothetical protein